MTKPAAEVTLGAVDENLFRFEAVVVRLLLALPEWSQARLAAESGIDQAQISQYQRGKRIPTPEVLNRLAQAAGWPLPFVEKLATTVIRVREVRGVPPLLDFGAASADAMYRAALQIEAGMVEIGRLIWADAERRKRAPRGEPAPPDRETADDLWSRLADLDANDRRMLVDFSPVFHLWSFAARLAEESERAAAEGAANPDRRSEAAVSLAQLALHVAEKCEVPPSFSACLRAYALGHLAHARRASGEPKAAETAWHEAWTLWRDDDPHTAVLLPKERLVSLETALLPGDWAH